MWPPSVWESGSPLLQPMSVIKPNDSIKMRFVPFMRKSICFHVAAAPVLVNVVRCGMRRQGLGPGQPLNHKLFLPTLLLTKLLKASIKYSLLVY